MAPQVGVVKGIFHISNKELALKIQELEKKYDSQFKSVFEAIRQFMTYPDDIFKLRYINSGQLR